MCVLFYVGSPCNTTEGSNRRLLVYQHCIPLCESGDLKTEVAADIIGLLMLEVHVSFYTRPHSELLLLMMKLFKGSNTDRILVVLSFKCVFTFCLPFLPFVYMSTAHLHLSHCHFASSMLCTDSCTVRTLSCTTGVPFC